MGKVSKRQAHSLIGQPIYAVRKDGTVTTGRLVRINGNQLAIAPLKSDKRKTVKTKAILPLVLFDLLAIGTLPYWGGGYGGGYNGGYGSECCYGGYGPNYQAAPYGYGQVYNNGYNY